MVGVCCFIDGGWLLVILVYIRSLMREREREGVGGF